MEYQFRPIERWPVEPTPEHERRSRYTFKADWYNTIDKLDHELWHLNADRIVFQVDIDPKNIRLDGRLRSGHEPNSPGVIVSFDSKYGPLSYPCDSCVYWRHNFRSIALALEALRKVDLYGVTRRAEQYKGWTAIQAPGEQNDFSGPSAAREFLQDLLFEESINWGAPGDAFRKAKTIAHPDNGGSKRQFQLVVRAIEIIGGDV